MPNNKNQHYVPQVYLRSFACDEVESEKRRTNAFIIKSQKILRGVSIRDQCSKSFFYGKEDLFDDFTNFFEGRHGLTMRALSGRAGEAPVYFDRITRFFLLQYLRTPHMLEQRRLARDHMENLVIAGMRPERIEFKNEREMQHQLYIAAKESDILDDLETILIKNRTQVPFITSDNPAICLNRYQAQKLGDPTSGLITSGLVAFMPLDPTWAYLAYDRDVYSIDAQDSIMEVSNVNDVHRLNELQALTATNCLYFSDLSASVHVRKAYDLAADRRRDSWNEIWVGVLDGEENGLERYRREKPEDRGSKEPRIVSWSPVFPTPHTWPSFLKFKFRPKGCDTSRMVGFIRQGAAQKEKYGTLPLVTLPSTVNPNLNPRTREFGYVGKGG